MKSSTKEHLMALEAGTVFATIKADVEPAITEIRRAQHAVMTLRREMASLARLRVGSFGDVEPPRRKV